MVRRGEEGIRGVGEEGKGRARRENSKEEGGMIRWIAKAERRKEVWTGVWRKKKPYGYERMGGYNCVRVTRK